jgi:mono/diheme cytochrome c family protein
MKFLGGILFGWLLLAIGLAVIVWSGVYNVAASGRPGKLETKIATFALNQSVHRRAPVAKNPFSRTPEVLRAGLAHYRENCVVCHGAPGVDATEYGEGLNPASPDLTLPRVQERPDGELFWIVSNGIRTTGMAAFGPTHKPEEIWKIVAFLRHLPEITSDEQKVLKTATAEAEHHGEAEASEAKGEAPKAPVPERKTPPQRHRSVTPARKG